MCKDPTTISKEVKLHRLSDWYHKGTFYNAHNFCIHRYHCKKTNVCGKIILCNIKCTSCPTCNQTCVDFVKEQCTRLDKARYVCNGCPKAINHCTIAHKYHYDAVFANRKYRECLSSSRFGINLTKHELHPKDMVITPLIYQGQSPYQIITNHTELDSVQSSQESKRVILTFFLTRACFEKWHQRSPQTKGKIAELALGYSDSVGALKAMGALDMGLPVDELQSLVNAGCSSNPHITQLWRDIDSTIKIL